MMILQIMVLLKSDGKLHGGCSGRFKKNYSILSNGWITVRNINGRLTRTAHYKVAVGSRFREDLNERSNYPLGALNVFLPTPKAGCPKPDSHLSQVKLPYFEFVRQEKLFLSTF